MVTNMVSMRILIVHISVDKDKVFMGHSEHVGDTTSRAKQKIDETNKKKTKH